jgi:crossover junction endodeoxyribonuclease RuvC
LRAEGRLRARGVRGEALGPVLCCTLRGLPYARAGQASGLARRILQAMIVLGIDPGLSSTGYGVVERTGGHFAALDGGVIETRAGLPIEHRLCGVAERMRAILSEHECAAVAIEELYFGQNVRTAFAVGHARGVTMLIAGEYGIPCFSYTPQKIKSSVCGHGRAEKDQVARMVQTLLSLERIPASDHASDALAVALCHLNGAPLADALAKATQPAGVSAYPMAGHT